MSYISSFKSTILALLLVAFLISSVASVPLSARANTQADLQAQLTQLLQIVAQMQAQLAAMQGQSFVGSPTPEGGFASKNIAVGDRVQTTDILRVRAEAGLGANWVNNIAAFTGGSVVGGPRYADGYTWWQVQYDNGTRGWSVENWLRVIQAATPIQSPSGKDKEQLNCEITASDKTVAPGEEFTISWEVDYNNPTFIVPWIGERSVDQSGEEEFVMEQGSATFTMGSSKLGEVCSVVVTVKETADEDDIQTAKLDDVCPFVWTRTMERGDEGVDVKRLKQFLNTDKDTAVHYQDGFNNEFDSDLTRAINKFQVKYRAHILSPLGLVNPTGEFDSATRAKVNSMCIGDDEEDLDPEVTLVYPKKNVTFDKSQRNDDIVLKWRARDVPANTNLNYEIESVQTFAGSFRTGSAGRVPAGPSAEEFRIAIDTEGTLDPGEYRVRLSLEECHSLGCNYHYPSGPNYEKLKVYDRSNYGYFTVIDSEEASVSLRIPGRGDIEEYVVDPEDKITLHYYPVGDIDECVIAGEYSDGVQEQEHSWPNTILSGQYGRSTFSAASPDGVLAFVTVECRNEAGQKVASDSLRVEVVGEDEAAQYEIVVDGDVEESGEASEATARAKCSAAFNEYRGVRVQCEWDGDEFFDETNWKG